MKYYSEITKNMYDNIEDLENAEQKLEEKTAARKQDAQEVEKAYDEMTATRRNYEKVLTDFCKKYGAYHKTIKSPATHFDKFTSLADLLDFLSF